MQKNLCKALLVELNLASPTSSKNLPFGLICAEELCPSAPMPLFFSCERLGSLARGSGGEEARLLSGQLGCCPFLGVLICLSDWCQLFQALVPPPLAAGQAEPRLNF